MALIVVIALLFLRSESFGESTDIFLRAAATTRIPVELLLAISHVESGFHPRALNVAGQALFPATLHEAESVLRRSGDNVDIGLMQINWAFWGKKLGVSKSELLDPKLNVLLGARILEHCLKVTGDWWQAVGMYHSPDASRQRMYVAKVSLSYGRLLTKLNR